MATSKRKITVKKPAETVVAAKTIAVKPRVVKKTATAPTVTLADNGFHIVGASGPIRTGRTLSPVVLDRIPAQFSERDSKFLSDLYAKYGRKQFERQKFDGGLMSRLVGHGYLELKTGNPDESTATFAITAKAVADRLQTA